MRHLLAASVLSALLVATPLAASTPDAAAPTGIVPAPEMQGDPRQERQRNTAAKLAGMVRFVAASCPEAQPNYDRFKNVIAAMGIDIKALESGPLMATSLSYSQAYDKITADSCKRAFENFGENGATLPGLIAKKAP